MVLPIGTGDVQTMQRITITEEGPVTETFERFSFVPMLEGKK